MSEIKDIGMPATPKPDPVLDHQIRCYNVEMKSVDDLSNRELFEGFDTMRAITFSVSASQLDRLLGLFEYAEVIVGAEFLVQRDNDLHGAFYQALAAADLSQEIPEKFPNIGERIRSGSLLMRTSNIVLDHRKLYILSSRDGRTRVITTSANMSGRAWGGDHLEQFERDETQLAYESRMIEFDVAWNMGADLPYEAGSVRDEDLISGNVLIKKALLIDKALLVPAQEEQIDKELVRYVVRQEKRADEYKSALKDVLRGRKPLKDGCYHIQPAVIEKAKNAYLKRQERRRVKMGVSEQAYPCMQFHYDPEVPAMSLDGRPLDLNPDEAGVRADIENLLEIFGYYEDDAGKFIGNLTGLRANHYRFMIYMLMAPHIARLRCASVTAGITETSLPLFIVLTSRQANTGKTFMVEALLCLMTGLPITGDKGGGDGVAGRIRDAQECVKGTPCLFDEVSSQSFSRSVKTALMDADECERKGRAQQPVIVVTSNDMADPPDVVRKRSIHLLFDAALRSDVDQNAFRNQGNRLKKRFTGAFYREFTRRILPWVAKTEDYIWYDEEKTPDWYPDVVNASSKIFLEILADYGYTVPDYMRVLTWNEDYSAARKAAENTIAEIQELYAVSPEIFTLSNGRVTVNLGTDSSNKKLMTSWYNTLPPEVQAKCRSSMQTGSELSMNQRALEQFGFRYKAPGSPQSAGMAVMQIQAQYTVDPGTFRFAGGRVSIDVGDDPDKQTLMRAWCDALPAGADAKCEGGVLTADLKALERLGFKRKKSFFGLAFRNRKGV